LAQKNATKAGFAIQGQVQRGKARRASKLCLFVLGAAADEIWKADEERASA
jgi:hypothetical protein